MGIMESEFEYCPRCDANLTLQKGFDRTLPHWICRGCGEMLINPATPSDSGIIWICDRCGATLNLQDGFDETLETWKCLKCGFLNPLGESEVFDYEDEYNAFMQNPYRGLSDEDILKLARYVEEGTAGNAVIVRDTVTGECRVKKLLDKYDKDIYRTLREHPVAHMPKIIDFYEGSNCLVVIEEYIEGKTLEQRLHESLLTEREAAEIIVSLCVIIETLHGFDPPIIHRDIKPSNIIINGEGEVYLLDINVATRYIPGEEGQAERVGTPDYAAPEQAGYGLSGLSPKTDVYALGILLNVMITGRLPREVIAGGRIGSIIERAIRLNVSERSTVRELYGKLRNFMDFPGKNIVDSADSANRADAEI